MHDRKQYKQLTRKEEQEHFRRLRENGDQESRAILVASLFRTCERMATKYCRNYRWHDTEEATAAAIEGALDAVDKFDPSYGFALVTYAARSIHSFMRDAYIRRGIISFPRTVLQKKFGHRKSSEMARQPNGFWDMAQENDLGELKPLDPEDGCYGPAQIAIFRDCGDEPESIVCLSEREKYIFRKYFLGGQTMKRIGKDIGISESRVSQVYSEIIAKLRTYYEVRGYR